MPARGRGPDGRIRELTRQRVHLPNGQEQQNDATVSTRTIKGFPSNLSIGANGGRGPASLPPGVAMAPDAG